MFSRLYTWIPLIAIWHMHVSASATCSVTPLFLPWRNVTVSENGLAITRGIEVGIGTPNQIFAFRPSAQLNNTRIFNELDCGNDTASPSYTSCVGSNGGVFDSSASSTYSVSIKSAWNGSLADDETSTGSYVYFNDKITFDNKGSVLGFPLVMDTELGQDAQSGLPVGVDSSFTNAVYKANAAPSSMWALWSGSRSHQPVDGALVLGGYDSSRVGGDFTQFPLGTWTLEQGCPLQVTIADIIYTIPNGSVQSLFTQNTSQNVVACIDPFQQRFTFSPDVVKRFESLTNHNPSFHSGLTYPVSAKPTGNLTITLDNGYTTTVSNTELVTKLRGSDAYGRYSILNDSIIDVGIAYNPNATDVISILGGLFLTFNYLLVDYAAGHFMLAPAIQGTQGQNSEVLVPICTPPSHPRSHLGTIVGAVVGGVVGLALIAGILSYFFLPRNSSWSWSSREVEKPDVPAPPITSQLIVPVHEMQSPSDIYSGVSYMGSPTLTVQEIGDSAQGRMCSGGVYEIGT